MAKPADLERVTIYWYAIPNENKSCGGWMPVIEHNGKQRGHTYGKGYELEDAIMMAKADAEEQASRYTGDWDVVVGPKAGAPGVAKASRKAPKAKKPRAASRETVGPHLAALRARSSPWGEADTASDSLPWRNSYANWTIRVGEAAAKHGAPIAFGSETHDAWKAGVSPDSYAKARARR